MHCHQYAPNAYTDTVYGTVSSNTAYVIPYTGLKRWSSGFNDRKIKALKGLEKLYKVSDGRQMYVTVSTTGSKVFRLDYKLKHADAKRGTLTLGRYPEIGLAEARELANDARALIANGIDPAETKRKITEAQSDRPTLRTVVKQWTDSMAGTWSAKHHKTLTQRLERDILQYHGDLPIDKLTPEMVSIRLGNAANRGALETAHRVGGIVRQFYRTKLVGELVPDAKHLMRDVAEDLAPLPPKRKRGHYPAIISPQRFGDMLKRMDGYAGAEQVKAALLLSPLLFLRPSELRLLEWVDIHFNDSMITNPAHRMKNREELLTPLSTQAVALFKELHKITGEGGLVFPSVLGRYDLPANQQKPISDLTVNKALRAVGIPKTEHTAHGFRASARTMIAERLGVPSEIIEIQLAHVGSDALHGAYNRTQYIEARIAMMQKWADFCGTLKANDANNTVVPFRTAAVA